MNMIEINLVFLSGFVAGCFVTICAYLLWQLIMRENMK